MVYVTGDKEAIRAYEMRQMALSDYTSTMNYARDEGMAQGMTQGMAQGMTQGMAQGMTQGMAQGMAQGREEGRNEERQRLLEMLNLGLPVEEIKRRLKE
jgi:flagellar biosynthesis/type III secretory pathway protein FliH